jgi:hypothetical protein
MQCKTRRIFGERSDLIGHPSKQYAAFRQSWALHPIPRFFELWINRHGMNASSACVQGGKVGLGAAGCGSIGEREPAASFDGRCIVRWLDQSLSRRE